MSLPQHDADRLGGVDIGVKLRHARLVKGLKIREVAEQAGCSESMLSKIECGKATPSLTRLHRIVQVLETNIGWLFEAPPENGELVSRAGTRPIITIDPVRRGAGLSLERIIPYTNGHLLQCNIHHIAPGGGSAGAIAHEGEEMGYVLEGAIELSVEGRTYTVGTGDSFYFRSERPHSYRNPFATDASVIWVNSPPTF